MVYYLSCPLELIFLIFLIFAKRDCLLRMEDCVGAELVLEGGFG